MCVCVQRTDNTAHIWESAAMNHFSHKWKKNLGFPALWLVCPGRAALMAAGAMINTRGWCYIFIGPNSSRWRAEGRFWRLLVRAASSRVAPLRLCPPWLPSRTFQNFSLHARTPPSHPVLLCSGTRRDERAGRASHTGQNVGPGPGEEPHRWTGAAVKVPWNYCPGHSGTPEDDGFKQVKDEPSRSCICERFWIFFKKNINQPSPSPLSSLMLTIGRYIHRILKSTFQHNRWLLPIRPDILSVHRISSEIDWNFNLTDKLQMFPPTSLRSVQIHSRKKKNQIGSFLNLFKPFYFLIKDKKYWRELLNCLVKKNRPKQQVWRLRGAR